MMQQFNNKAHFSAALIFILGLFTFSCAGDQQAVQEGVENYEYQEGENGISNQEANGGSNNFGEGGNNYGNNYGNEEGGEESGEEGGDNYGNNYGNNIAANDSENGNSNNGSYNYNNGGAANNSGGELINNATDDELFTNETLTNNSLEGNALNNSLEGDAELAADTELVNGAGYEGNAALAPTAGQSANALPNEYGGAPAPTFSGTPPPPGGIVKYILGEVSLLAQPGGAAVRTLRKGDHPVLYDMGEYHQTMEGYFVPSTSVTTEATGRDRNSGYWR